jgi:hypothetical protein
MKKRAKFYLILMAVGLLGIAVIVSYSVGTGSFTSYEATKAFYPEGSFTTIQVDASRAQVKVLPSEEVPKIEVFAKAWLPGPIDLTKRFVWTVDNQRLVLTEIPFEPIFLGFFPQPYEMTITAYVPQAVYDSFLGGRP